MHREPPALLIAALAAAAACTAPPTLARQGVVPDAVKARVNDLVAACVRAGGTLGDMSGQGRFVIPADFNGDGLTDFVVSEGNVPCTGRPQLFRDGGLSRVELYTGTGTAAAQLAFADRLLAYRVVAGSPAKLQIARRGEACGAGSGASAQCGAELRWNAGQARFDEVPTGSRGGPGQAVVRPAVVEGVAVPAAGAGTVAPASAPTPVAAAVPAAAAGPAAPTLPMVANARARHMERCSAEHRRLYPQMAADAAASSCGDQWEKVEAAGPLADLVLSMVPARAGERLSLADLRARLPGSQWDAHPATARGQAMPAATGRVGAFEAWVSGSAAAAKSLTLGWSEQGADPPYDLPGALAARGAKVEALGCYHFGIVEVNAAYIVEAEGRPPFALTVYTRGAPVGQSIAAQTFEVGLDGVLPTKAGLRAEHRDPPWSDPCPV